MSANGAKCLPFWCHNLKEHQTGTYFRIFPLSYFLVKNLFQKLALFLSSGKSIKSTILGQLNGANLYLQTILSYVDVLLGYNTVCTCRW